MDSFESISFYVLSFVKNLPGVKDLEYHEFPAAEQSDFQQWQVFKLVCVCEACLHRCVPHAGR